LGVEGGDREAAAGVADLVEAGLLGGDDELGRGADGEQLEGGAGEGGDGGVLVAGVAQPQAGEVAAGRRRERVDAVLGDMS
jgi:hypothetical protein